MLRLGFEIKLKINACWPGQFLKKGRPETDLTLCSLIKITNLVLENGGA